MRHSLKKIKLEAAQEVLADKSLSNLEKLRQLSENDVWGVSTYINHEFPEYEKEIIELERLEAVRLDEAGESKFFYHSKMTDSRFDPSHMEYEKYETVRYIDSIDDILEANDIDGDMVVMTTRNPHTELRKPVREVIDTICQFCFDNKIIGYKVDW